MNGKSLAEHMDSRRNNLDIIRFFAAVLVVYSHAFPLVYSNNDKEPLRIFSNQLTFGGLAVAVFFIISGFLITQSFDRSKNLINYLKSRVLRLFPGLLICLIFTAFVLGPLLSIYPLSEYFSNSELYKYFIAITLLPHLSPSLPGVFENNPFGNFVNGSLWTLKFEFIYYIAIALIGTFGLLNKKFVIFVFGSASLLSLLSLNSHLHNLFILGSYFLGGTLLYLFRNKVKLKFSFALISLVIILLASQIGLLEIAIAIFGSYTVIYLGYQQKIVFTNFTKYGDFSYGIYIYAFPIQQAVISILGKDITPLQNFFISLPIIIILSFFSWHLVEKRALKLKHMSIFKGTKNAKVA